MRIIIIRHAEPDYEHNTITPRGFKEADALADRLVNEKIDYIYVSPLGRAKDTIKEYLNRTNKKAVEMNWLQEFCYPYKINGELRYIPWDFKVKETSEIEGFYDYSKFLESTIFKNTEVEKMYKIVCDEFDNLLTKHGYKRKDNYYEVTNSNKDTLVFVCHLGLESVLLSRLINIPFNVIAQHFSPSPSSVSILYTEERQPGVAQFRAHCLGDYSHLTIKGIEPSFMGRFRENGFDDGRKD